MYQKTTTIRFGGPVTPGVKKLLIINASIFIMQQIAGLVSDSRIPELIFGLSHQGFIGSLMLWQPFTYMFLHAGWAHIFLNLLGLWMFAGEVELYLGEKRFIRFYIISGFIAGLFIALLNYYVFLAYNDIGVTIGASGALYAVMIAYAVLWPNREVQLYFIFPIKVKYLMLAYGVFEFFSTLSTAAGKAGNISHIGHIGGLVAGYILIKLYKNASVGKNGKVSFFERIKKSRRLKTKKKEIDERIEAKRIIDGIMAKIAREGMSSLTSAEKKQLEWARRHYYPAGNDTVH